MAKYYIQLFSSTQYFYLILVKHLMTILQILYCKPVRATKH